MNIESVLQAVATLAVLIWQCTRLGKLAPNEDANGPRTRADIADSRGFFSNLSARIRNIRAGPRPIQARKTTDEQSRGLLRQLTFQVVHLLGYQSRQRDHRVRKFQSCQGACRAEHCAIGGKQSALECDSHITAVLR